MSWLDKISTQLTIQTGDGKEYTPNWLNASKGIEYNIAEFEFSKIPGTLVKRTEPKGTRYPVELYFQGEDHLDVATAFEVSANDKRPWVITHPYYGRLTVQPISLNFDHTIHNISKITGTVVETILEDYPSTVIDAVDKITEDAATSNETMAVVFDNDVDPTESDISKMKAFATKLQTIGDKYNTLSENYYNAFSTANSKLTNATAEPLAAMRSLQTFIAAPAQFATTVQKRMDVLEEQFDNVSNDLATVFTTKNLKGIYQSIAGTLISTTALSTATPQAGDYGSRNDVLNIITRVTDMWDSYLTNLDALQSDDGGDVDSFIPDINAITDLNDLINFTVSNLFAIALESKQERSVVVEYDTNVIILAHRFYGLNATDSTIDDIINQNSLGLNGILQVPANTPIVYYV